MWGGTNLIIAILVFLISAFGWLTESDIISFDFSVFPWNFSSACFSLGFFAIGNASMKLFEKFPFKERIQKSYLCRIAIFILMFIVLIPIALLNGHVSIGSRILNNGFLFYLTGILGSFGILSLADIFKSSKFLNYCGHNSFTIMGSHILVYGVIEIIASAARHFGFQFELYPNSPIYGTILFFIVTIFTLLFVAFYNKLKERLFQRG